MNDEQVLEKIEELTDDIANNIRVIAKKALKSGALNTSGYPDGYLLPKIILTACLKELAFQYLPLTEEARNVAKNLERFL